MMTLNAQELKRRVAAGEPILTWEEADYILLTFLECRPAHALITRSQDSSTTEQDSAARREELKRLVREPLEILLLAVPDSKTADAKRALQELLDCVDSADKDKCEVAARNFRAVMVTPQLAALTKKVDEVGATVAAEGEKTRADLKLIAENAAIAAGKKKVAITNGKKARSKQLRMAEVVGERREQANERNKWRKRVKRKMNSNHLSARSAAKIVWENAKRLWNEPCPYKQSYLASLVGKKRKA